MAPAATSAGICLRSVAASDSLVFEQRLEIGSAGKHDEHILRQREGPRHVLQNVAPAVTDRSRSSVGLTRSVVAK